MTLPNYSNSKTSAFILCAGSGERWNNYLGMPKQHIKFANETLLERTVRLLINTKKDIGIYIVTNDKRLEQLGCNVIVPVSFDLTIHSFLGTQPYWSENNIVLLGDVFYSNRSIAILTRQIQEIHFFGKVGRSKFGKKSHGEIYAFVFDRGNQNVIAKGVENILAYTNKGGIGNLWDLYHHLAQLPYNSGRVERNIFQLLNDYTDDFDTPEDYNLTKGYYQIIAGPFTIKKLALLCFLKISEWINNWHARRFKGYQKDHWEFAAK